jgi:hypothetical protein
MFQDNIPPPLSGLKSTLKMGAVHFSETYVTTYRITWHHNPEDYK